jgi:hypothetical protein
VGSSSIGREVGGVGTVERRIIPVSQPQKDADRAQQLRELYQSKQQTI